MLAANEHEYAEIKKSEMPMEGVSFKKLQDSSPVSLSELVANTKLVLLWYFAPWCENSNYDIPTVKKLYAKYKDKGLTVLAGGNYSTVDELKAYVKDQALSFPVVYETAEKSESNRLNSFHYKFRSALGDTRKWGTPLSVFILKEDLEVPYVVAGELVLDKAEKFIDDRLGLTPSKAKAKE